MGAWPRGRWTPLPFRTRSGCRTPASCPPVTAAGARRWPGGAVSPALTGDPVFQVTSREPEFLTGPHWACLLRPYCFHCPRRNVLRSPPGMGLLTPTPGLSPGQRWAGPCDGQAAEALGWELGARAGRGRARAGASAERGPSGGLGAQTPVLPRPAPPFLLSAAVPAPSRGSVPSGLAC